MQQPLLLQEARAALAEAAAEVFCAEPEAHSIGIGRVDGALGFVVEYRSAQQPQPRPLGSGCLFPDHRPDRPRRPARLDRWPLAWRSTPARAQPLAHLPRARRSLGGARHPEQHPTRPLVCGLEIQNLDADHRAGALPRGCFVGTLGCFVRTAQGEVAMLSNAHVLADSGRGHVGRDRILQAGCLAFDPAHHVAHLGGFMPLEACPPGTRWGHPLAVPNVADAALAPLLRDVPFVQGYLGAREAPCPRHTATPALGEPVFKIGRTTGLTRGTVDRVNVIYSIPYDDGDCWFQDLFSVVCEGGHDFADGGDSGAVVLRGDGTVVGLLFAGARMGVLCSEIEPVLSGLGCTLL